MFPNNFKLLNIITFLWYSPKGKLKLTGSNVYRIWDTGTPIRSLKGAKSLPEPGSRTLKRLHNKRYTSFNCLVFALKSLLPSEIICCMFERANILYIEKANYKRKLNH